MKMRHKGTSTTSATNRLEVRLLDRPVLPPLICAKDSFVRTSGLLYTSPPCGRDKAMNSLSSTSLRHAQGSLIYRTYL